MADYIVIRLVPPTPVDPATFGTYLSGLRLQVYDASYAHPLAGTPGDPTPPFGTAQYQDPILESLPALYPGGAPYVTYAPGTGIVQHFDLELNSAGTEVVAVNFVSVATAVIAVSPGLPEYVTSDIRAAIVRPAAQTVFDGNVYYDVSVYSGAAPAPEEYPALSAGSYLTLPAITDPNLASLQVPSDGSAPNYDALITAINKVVVKDPATDPDLASLIAAAGPLSVSQARNIAYEIVWGSQPALPVANDSLENMYTDPPNSGTSANSYEQSRQQFEGGLSSFYSTRDAQAEQLTKFVFSASAAIWCELQTQSATSAYWLFPTNPNGSSALATVMTADVVLTGTPGSLTITVPAAYFYALTALIPVQISPAQRLQTTCGANEQQNLTQLIAAVDGNVITLPGGAPDPSQAVRMLNALAAPGTSVTQCPVSLIQPLWSDWLAWTPADWRQYQAGDELEEFWPTEVAKPAPVPNAFLELVLYALTDGYVISGSLPPMLLADDIKANLIVHGTDGSLLFSGVDTVGELAQALQSDWQAFFDGSPLPPPLTASMRANLLPPFTNPGGVTAFIQYVRKFFDMPTPTPVFGSGGGAAPSSLDLPTVDWIEACLTAYGPFIFGTPLTAADLLNLQAAAASVFPGDTQAQQWVVQIIVTINELTICAVIAGTSAAQQFSIAEALFARGFTGFDSILDRPLDNFQQALTGTVAYDYAATIYANAGAPHTFPTTGIGPFGPINDGTLRNCIPPRYLSPLGPIEYLHEMLQVSEASTCSSPAAPPTPGHTTLEGALDPRRGPLGSLLVTDANLSTPIPLIDIVNESLEFMASTMPPTAHGTIYNTAGDVVVDHRLCAEPCCEPGERHPGCHKPADLFAALPQFSTPAVPVADNAAVEPAVYNVLKNTFSSCCLPYSQAIDLSETYLKFFGSCRFEELRSFRRCITEFVLDPVNEPSGFQSHLWRYPVRIDTAIAYLGITPEEYVTLFQGPWPASCAAPTSRIGTEFDAPPPTWTLYGFENQTQNQQSWIDITLRLPQFLRRLCLTYCEFLELWRCGYVAFSNGAAADGKFPVCEPCCLDDLWLKFPATPGAAQALFEIYLFVRLHRKLQDVCGARYSFVELADICSVLQLFPANVLNPDFIRQLAAFQMLRDRFKLPLVDKKNPAPTGSGAERTALLALWAGPGAAKWDWALHQLLHGVAHHACRHEHRSPEFIKLLVSNLDPLSRLAGFNPSISSDAWDALPTHTLRFAEVLAKIYASSFGVGELLYLFTADPQLDGNEPFPLQYDDEALDYPLGIPDDEHAHSLARLRRELLDAESREHAWQEWEWPRVAGFLVNELGIARASVQALGEHLFPGILRAAGVAVPPADVRYAVDLDPAQTVPQMWATQPGAPFEFDLLSATAGQLSTRTPLRDTAVIEQLTHLRPLQLAERIAVQSLYWQPRADLAQFAAVFTDLPDAEHHLIEEEGETRRWEYFRRHAVLCHERCQILARHLAKHVSDVTGDPLDDGVRQAALILKQLFADENRATADWQGSDAGSVPPVTWSPPPAGGAWAALLGLSGTGLVREYSIDGSGVVWRDVSGALAGFGTARNEHNCPVPTVIPALDLALDPQQLQFASVLNGIGIRDSNDEWLGGAQGFCVRWTGALLVDEDGLYEFCAGRPADHGLRPICDDHERARWRVELKRGQSTCVLLEHGHPAARVSTQRVELRRGAYDVHIRFEQLPLAGDEYVRRQHTGFQLKWKGPDTGDQLSEIPRSHLYCVSKNANLAAGIAPISSGAAAFLHNRYFSTLRDIRRTYQRAFKALVFAHRLRLSAHPGADHRGALEYLLSQPARFVGVSYYRAGGGFVRHAANFDFNFLPLLDNYYAPAAAQDSRVSPSLQREQALFDWWERLWDFGRAREEVFKRCERHLWRLCEEAAAIMPAHPQYLLRHMGADVRHWDLDTRFYQDQNNPVYVLTSADLSDDRWVIRAWHADLWIRGMQRCFTVKDITRARPDLWASLDPSALVSGETQTGNTNLSSVLGDGLLESGQPCRYADLQQLNDGLRERGRHALLAYLCGTTGIVHSPKALSELLLIDVETGLCERATRIDEAISAVQLFVQRARLGLEPGWVVTRNFASLWDARFASFHGWEVCKRRELYKENWIDWHELDRARKIESFQFLDGELRRATLTIATPGGVDYWPDERPPPHAALTLLQQRDPSTMKLLAAPREGLGLLGTPDAAGRPSWLAPVTDAAPTIAPPPSGNGLAPISVTAARARRTEQLPLWMEAAMRLGTRFIRVAAAAYPPAAMPFEPREDPAGHGPSERCVECCAECGCVHPRHMDEYYFWLVDASRYDASTQDSYYDYNLQQATPWEEEPSLSQLLQWPAQPIVRLAWCRVHNGNFHPPRRSVHGIEVPAGSTPLPDLLWAGRAADSLYFTVSNAATSTAPNPGFRYDIATDTAAAEGNLTVPAIPASEFPGALNAYPYFAYHHPGARLFPWSLFTPAVAVAEALRTHCKFEAALKWYALVYAPLDSDNTWVHCNAHASPPAGAPSIIVEPPSLCCDSTDVSCAVARNRAALLHYLETLLQWSEAAWRRNSPEAFQHARLLLDTCAKILGPKPATILNVGDGAVQTVATFVPLIPALNPRLIELYEHVADRLDVVHACLTARRLTLDPLRGEAGYWGDDPVRHGWRTRMEPCAEGGEWCYPVSPYRFAFLVQKAQELAGRVHELGAALLAAIEKGDAEYLAAMRQRQEHELLTLGRRVREDQWRDSDWQVQALQKAKESDQSSRRYYSNLISDGEIPNEFGYDMQSALALEERIAGNALEGVAESLEVTPDVFVGFPCNETQVPAGSKLAGLFKTLARVANSLADIAGTSASQDLTHAGWDRRLQDWVHQVEVLDINIEQAELQILGAERRRDQAIRELNNQEREIENSKEVLDFLRDKFTSHSCYLWLQKESARLHYQTYELALHTARQAERAFNLECGHTTRRFLPDSCWSDLRDGLLAGERLQLALSSMEKEYLDRNVRELELSTDFALRRDFPMAFLRLKLTGRCEIEIPEWMFDLEYPGHYMRRIKSMSLTIPCVVGPYTGVHCRLTLLGSQTRIDPSLATPAPRCCDRCHPSNAYEACPHDPRVVRQFGAREAIATSRAQNDPGLFELNFRDERHLPFEYSGAVSRWRVELPQESNYFDMDSLSEVILHVNYTAREGGSLLRRAAENAAWDRLPNRGWCLFDVRHDFPDAWAALQRNHRGERPLHRELRVGFDRRLFPFVPGARELAIAKLALVFEAPQLHDEEYCPGDSCACPPVDRRARHRVELAWTCREGAKDRVKDEEASELRCERSIDWPEYYHGALDTRARRVGYRVDECEAWLRFPEEICDLPRVYLLCRYTVDRRPRPQPPVKLDCLQAPPPVTSTTTVPTGRSL